MYLLDTNIISETRRILSGKSNVGVATWVSQTLAIDMYTSVVVMMEIERGILSIRRKDMAQAQILQRWVDTKVIPAFKGRVLTINEQTASICAALHIPDHAPENDAWIAATALQYNLTLVTRNVSDFERTPVKLLNPFSKKSHYKT